MCLISSSPSPEDFAEDNIFSNCARLSADASNGAVIGEAESPGTAALGSADDALARMRFIHGLSIGPGVITGKWTEGQRAETENEPEDRAKSPEVPCGIAPIDRFCPHQRHTIFCALLCGHLQLVQIQTVSADGCSVQTLGLPRCLPADPAVFRSVCIFFSSSATRRSCRISFLLGEYCQDDQGVYRFESHAGIADVP